MRGLLHNWLPEEHHNIHGTGPEALPRAILVEANVKALCDDPLATNLKQ